MQKSWAEAKPTLLYRNATGDSIEYAKNAKAYHFFDFLMFDFLPPNDQELDYETKPKAVRGIRMLASG